MFVLHLVFMVIYALFVISIASMCIVDLLNECCMTVWCIILFVCSCYRPGDCRRKV